MERWLASFDAEVARNTPPVPDNVARARGYVVVSTRIDEATQTKMVGMLVTLLQSPGYLHRARPWYAEWIGIFDPGSASERRARTAFLAAEGAFYLRSLGFVEIDQAGWDDVFDDILRLV